MSAEHIERLNTALQGRYRVERQLGEGGMATVYLADDLKHERRVALKVLKPELAAVVGAERFLAEIKTTANLQHPHILALFDSGEADSFLFYVMPYVEGESLRERLDRDRQLSVDEAVRIATNVGEALEYAHTHGVIHRDIKPANILLQSGKPVVSDFGIALAVTTGGAGRLTETGLSLGTPHYMSPEQATGDLSVGASSDVYALGCVLYEMLVGEPPHTGATAQAILGKIVTGEPDPVTKHRRSVPANVEASVRRALEKVPADRFADAGDFVRALTDSSFRHGDESGARGRVASPWLRWVAALSSAAAITLAGITLWLLTSDGTGDGPGGATEATIFRELIPEGLILATAQGMAISRDGRTLVYRASGQLYRRDFGSFEAVPIPGTQAPWMPFFDPTGEWIGFVDAATNRLERVRLDGSELQDLGEAPPTGRSGAWGPDGTIVFSSTSLNGLVRVPASGGDVERDVGPPMAWIDLLPDGHTVIGNLPSDDLGLVNLNTGAERVLFPGAMGRYAAGQSVYWRNGSLWAAPFDLDRLEVTGDHTMIVSGARSAENLVARFVVSDDVLVYQRGGFSTQTYGMPVWVDTDGNEEPIQVERGMYMWPRVSPDGSKLAVVRREDDNDDVWVYDLATGVPTRLTVHESTDQTPVWTPDSRRVVFRSTRGGTSNLYSRSVDGSDDVRRLTESPDYQRPVAFAPDGSLLFETFEPGLPQGRDVWVLPGAPGSEPTRFLSQSYDESHPTLSPDGAYIAYQSSELGYPEVFVRSFPELVGGRMVSTLDIGRLTSGTDSDPREARAPVWSRDGSSLYYQSGGAIVRVPMSTVGGLSPGVPEEAFRGGGWPFITEGRHYDVHPDGQRFVRIRIVPPEASGVPPNELIVVQNWMALVNQRRGAPTGPS